MNKYANTGLNNDAEYQDAVNVLAMYEGSDDEDQYDYDPEELAAAIDIVVKESPKGSQLW